MDLKNFIGDNLSGFSPKALPAFFFAFFVCALLSYLLSIIYVKYGSAVSNRRSFAKNFILLAITTMFIISVVKSSLALSLGLVGALSIVRFRSAIKEPQELTYLFLTISIGLGCGAGLTILTILAFIGFWLVIIFSSRLKHVAEDQHLYLTISTNNRNNITTEDIVNAIKDQCSFIKLKRTDENPVAIEISLYVEIENLTNLEKAKQNLKNLNPSLSITFMDSSRDL